MQWKFWQTQQRAAGYTDAIVTALAARAAGNVDADTAQTAAEETLRGVWGRAFASASVSPDTAATRALDAPLLEMVGRELFDHGEAVFEIDVADGRVSLIPVCSWQIMGRLPADWVYRIDIACPDATLTRYRPADAVLHLRYGNGAAHPWRGSGPMQGAATSRRLGARIETRLSQEAGSAVGSVIPVPTIDGTSQLQSDIAALTGGNVLVPSTSDSWGEPGNRAPRADWRPQRLGANPPPALTGLRADVSEQLAGAAGVPAALLSNNADGTARRESWRQFLHGVLQPLAAILLPELRRKLDTPDLQLSFDTLFASDLSGRARAFQSMVGGGLSLEKAAALSGLMESEE